ncbi:ADP-ribosylation/Crystallin J1 [Lophiotrema nucula]|uniref:ADP-ribosylhydrolase ARH3 n=1 Tax=Lophiotrema nucula TaxID=690887 RepID=A0A6A5YUG8_9PLEO|nr:ADP-ribosylation/Crystallin J1 [Lophiotrema nucula]
MTDHRKSRTLGALLGVHAGDSLGATLEFMRWSQIRKSYPKGLREIVGGGPFSWPAGHATDDTDLTRAVLLAYRDIETKEKPAEDVRTFRLTQTAAEYSLKWFLGDWPDRDQGSTPVDVGGATRTALMNYMQSKDASKSGAGKGAAGNGSLMRCVSTGLFARSADRRIEESMAISAFTHNDVRCTVSCAAYNEMVAALVEGKTPAEAAQAGIDTAEDLECSSVAEAIREGTQTSLTDIKDEKCSGFVLHSLKVSVAALLDPLSFEDVLVGVVGTGGDTDTNGAIAGGLLGARDGIEAIPGRWLEKLQFREEFERVAEEILESQKTGKA